MSRIGKWRRKTNRSDYVVYCLPQKPMHNPHCVVVKKEYGDWVSFVDMGRDGGTKVLNRYGTKAFNLFKAKEYMRRHPYG